MVNAALEQLADDEVRALALLLAGDVPADSGRRVFVVTIVAEENGWCVITSAPSTSGPTGTASEIQVLGFAQGLERTARRLRATLSQEPDHA